jgi:hypothetical protein
MDRAGGHSQQGEQDRDSRYVVQFTCDECETLPPRGFEHGASEKVQRCPQYRRQRGSWGKYRVRHTNQPGQERGWRAEARDQAPDDDREHTVATEPALDGRDPARLRCKTAVLI